MNITVVGGSGFLGRHVVRHLVAGGHHCRVLTRNAPRRAALRLQQGVELDQCDVYDQAVLARAFTGADAVLSMAGILNERGFGGHGFHRVHVTLVERVVAAARQAGVTRILHVSALNAGQGDSHYLKSKGEGERVLRESGLEVAIFRPSVVFGPGDSFFRRFAALLRLSPVLPLACPGARLQPVFAGDVGAAVRRVLETGATGVFELGGPRVYTLAELVRYTARTLGLRRWIPGLPRGLSRLQAAIMDFVPGKPFSTDNYRSLQVANLTADNALPKLDIRPASVEAIVPSYLGHSPRQSRLDRFRRGQPPG